MYILQIYKLELTKKNFQYSYLVILVNTFPTSESWLTSYSPPLPDRGAIATFLSSGRMGFILPTSKSY